MLACARLHLVRVASSVGRIFCNSTSAIGCIGLLNMGGGESGCGHNQSREGAVVAKNEGGGSTLMMEYTKCSWNKEKRESVFRGSKSRIEV